MEKSVVGRRRHASTDWIFLSHSSVRMSCSEAQDHLNDSGDVLRSVWREIVRIAFQMVKSYFERQDCGVLRSDVALKNWLGGGFEWWAAIAGCEGDLAIVVYACGERNYSGRRLWEIFCEVWLWVWMWVGWGGAVVRCIWSEEERQGKRRRCPPQWNGAPAPVPAAASAWVWCRIALPRSLNLLLLPNPHLPPPVTESDGSERIANSWSTTAAFRTGRCAHRKWISQCMNFSGVYGSYHIVDVEGFGFYRRKLHFSPPTQNQRCQRKSILALG